MFNIIGCQGNEMTTLHVIGEAAEKETGPSDVNGNVERYNCPG